MNIVTTSRCLTKMILFALIFFEHKALKKLQICRIVPFTVLCSENAYCSKKETPANILMSKISTGAGGLLAPELERWEDGEWKFRAGTMEKPELEFFLN